MALHGNQPLPGLHPIGNGVGGTAPRIRHYDVSATYATTIAEGCLVIKDTLGVNMAAAAGTANATLANVVGVFAHNIDASPGAGTKVAVYDDPQQEFVAPMDATLTTTAAIEAVGQFIGCVSNVYNATLGQGKLLLDTSSITATKTNTVYLQVVGIQQDVGDSLAEQTINSVTYFGALRVKIADSIHQYASGNAGRLT